MYYLILSELAAIFIIEWLVVPEMAHHRAYMAQVAKTDQEQDKLEGRP